MSAPCLHCEIMGTIRDHARRAGATLHGKPICDRAEAINMLATVLGELIYSDPDPQQRLAFVEDISLLLLDIARTPGSAQPRGDMEVASWQ